MQRYNLQNSFKGSMLKQDDTIKAILSRKMSTTKKENKRGKLDQSLEKSNFMSKISNL